MKDNHLIDMTDDKADLGKVEISPEVIEVIAGLAGSEIEGVATMRGNFASGVAERLGRKNNHGKGVKVDLQEDGITVDVFVITNYGVSIPDVCKKVQENIFQTLKNMTAIELIGVNVHVVGVQLEIEKKEEPKKDQ
ncbi:MULTISPECIES: Asp23/Gls24 family envelope stress response protein [Alteribacter]|uniref:Asp23/Gls24 family envelope stress response protein n=1 Tax=Alteribacter keqinensis TaxID=2483800 RepID=A0A3M7TUP5_9BACI|nr:MULTISPECIES: Asp23/Gls24 family envelope stress response protein [Alteribacter]MBM7097283.1 Asp23/Gls24 family envelope stress response protein [Alteribacter salitolerans]RNA68981.1 Asp23/Gls24 family envelope stress response protein [Alteribacter keqinensis]